MDIWPKYHRIYYRSYQHEISQDYHNLSIVFFARPVQVPGRQTTMKCVCQEATNDSRTSSTLTQRSDPDVDVHI